MAKTTLAIACGSAFWGDTPLATAQLLTADRLDFIVYDYLSEVTMTLLAKMKSRDPSAGYTPDFLTDVIEPHLATCKERGIRLIANAGGTNPRGLKAKIEKFATERGLSVRVAAVEGDDVTSLMKEKVVSANAYLGAAGIVAALEGGADVVVTGRCVDSALVLAPAIHHFGWKWDDHSRLSQASLAGHVIECGTQCTGGNFTDWHSVPGRENVGFPIVHLDDSGAFEIGKPGGTGGLVTVASVAEQILYEIGDPANFLLPDVICDWSHVKLEQKGADVVRVTGARGRAPTEVYKVAMTEFAGHRVSATAFVAGGDAKAKARSIGEAVLLRANRALHEKGLARYGETLVETVGGPDQVLLRISATHEDQRALEILAKEIAPAATSLAPGVTSLLGGRATPTPRVTFKSALLPKRDVKVTVEIGSQTKGVDVLPGHAEAAPVPAAASTHTTSRSHEKTRVRLGRIAFARSGDKGNDVNIGVIARDPKWVPVLREYLDVRTVASIFADDFDSPTKADVLRWEAPGLAAFNFLLKDCLGGGGSYSLRIDPQGKAFAQRLLDATIEVPKEMVTP